MTTHDKDKIIALRNEADKFATEKLLCEGEYHPDFHTVSDERFYAIAFAAGAAQRHAEIAELAEALEHSVLYVPDLATVPGIAAVLAKVRKP